MDENLTAEEIKAEKPGTATEYQNEACDAEKKSSAHTEKNEKENNMSSNMPKLKTHSGLKSFDAFLWVFTTIIGTLIGVIGSFTVAVGSMVNYASEYNALIGMNENIGAEEAQEALRWLETYPWIVYFQYETAKEDVLSALILLVVILGLVFAAGMVLLCVYTGRFKHESDGSIQLNLFDRIWSELILALGCAAATAAVCLAYPMYEIWPHIEMEKIYKPMLADEHWFGASNWLIIVLCIAGMAVAVLLTMLCFVSLVKKLKAHKFWEKSLLGKLLGVIAKGTRNSVGAVVNAVKTTDNFMLKYVGIFVGMTILAMTWVGAVVDIILIFIFVPRKVKTFEAIRKGVSEVKDGNLAYKIAVSLNGNGEAETELDALAADINQISEASEIAVQNELKNQRMKTELISNVSHDLKTPLTSMLSYVDLLKKEGLGSPNAAEYLRIIDEKTNRLKVLTENLFEAAKASSGDMPVNAEAIDLAALVSQSLGETDAKLRARTLTTIVKNSCIDDEKTSAADGCGPMVMADGKLLWRVLENLLGNVSKYALENSRVYIDISREGEMISLEIKNISKEQLNISSEELTERFKRGDASRNTEGSGLGLAIAKDLVKLMGGSFELTIDGDLFKAKVSLPEA